MYHPQPTALRTVTDDRLYLIRGNKFFSPHAHGGAAPRTTTTGTLTPPLARPRAARGRRARLQLLAKEFTKNKPAITEKKL